MLIELCANTWLEPAEIDEIWSEIPKARDFDGDDVELVNKKALKEYVIERSFRKALVV